MPFNLNHAWDDKDVRALLSSVRDDHNYRIVIEKSGEVKIINWDSHPVPFESLYAWFEVYAAGTDHVGPDAAGDDKHVQMIVDTLKSNWPNLSGDQFLDH
ncbi:hypothetical protein Gbfr_021_253 [Gluconobacter frateurii M-2]|nr:hypothetical protein Gbfr_021_253 [Gluconobacter frateurii M-2]